jgi:hypothetical protein
MHLQTLVLAMAGAGLGTCKAAAVIKQDQQLMLFWVSARLGLATYMQQAEQQSERPTLDSLQKHLKHALDSGKLGTADMLLTYIDGEVANGRFDQSDKDLVGCAVQSTFRCAAWQGYYDTCCVILQHLPPSPAYSSWSPVQQRAKHGDYSLVNLMLHYTPEPATRSVIAATAAIWASQHGHTDGLEHLVHHMSNEDKLLMFSVVSSSVPAEQHVPTHPLLPLLAESLGPQAQEAQDLGDDATRATQMEAIRMQFYEAWLDTIGDAYEDAEPEPQPAAEPRIRVKISVPHRARARVRVTFMFSAEAAT